MEEVAVVMGYNDGSWGAGDWVAMSAMMLVFWGAIVALVIWAVRTPRSRQAVASPKEILAERFARGDIDDDEFRRRRDALAGAGSPSGTERS